MKTHLKLLALSTIFIITTCGKSQVPAAKTDRTASAIISEIIGRTGAPAIPNTVDVIKEGDPQTRVTGIVTTMFGTMDVLKKAVALKANLIIVHEPLYYNHTDNKDQFRDNEVFLEKQKFINDNKLVIWRFHDYIHSIRPDGIMSGMIEKLGWEGFAVKGTGNSFDLTETTLRDLITFLKTKFDDNPFHVIGDPEMKLTHVRLLPGAPGSMSHIRALSDKGVEVVIAGEVPQWETYEYMRDAVSQGRKKAIIFLGHIPSEEAGMEFCAGWLKGFIPDMPVNFVSSGPSYRTF